jgi:hypothetical protein
MRGMRPSRIVVVLVLLACFAAGCGEDARHVAAPTVAEPAPPDPTLAIERPGIEPITASESNGELRVTADVTGRATAGSFVQVSADCEERRCKTGAQADAAGNWAARVLIIGYGEGRANVRLVAQSGAQVSLALARLRARARRTVGKAKTKAKDKATRTARRTATAPAPAAPAASTATAPATSPSASRLVMVGDSLSVGTKAPLASILPGWDVTTDGRTGRPLAEGMRIIRALPSPPPILAVSLFTNDGPTSVTALEDAVRETITMQAGHGCVIWATIVRPAVGGTTYDRANAALARLADANPTVMRLVPWARQIAAHPESLAGDGVHATPAGYTARAQLYAAAARSCTS